MFVTPAKPLLFTPLTLRDVTLRNRIVLAPMCQYSAQDGVAGDWHLVHLGKFALGGMGLVMTEAAAVERRGRITHGDLGIWSDEHIPGLRRVTDFLRAQGATPAIQLAHAGRKGSWQRPWEGHAPLGSADAERGDAGWRVVGATTDPYQPHAPPPAMLSEQEIGEIAASFGAAAGRAHAAGFDVVEVHGGHGYLLASFLSAAVNTRKDGYGGSLAARMRFPLEVAEQVRQHWPTGKPLFFRMSVVDGTEDGWTVDDSLVLARELTRRGVDVIDCSSGGVREANTLARTFPGLGFQVPYASTLRARCATKTIAVGFILDGPQAEAVLQSGHADLIAIGREALYDPYWAHHAAQVLGADPAFAGWAPQSGWWLERRSRLIAPPMPCRPTGDA